MRNIAWIGLASMMGLALASCGGGEGSQGSAGEGGAGASSGAAGSANGGSNAGGSANGGSSAGGSNAGGTSANGGTGAGGTSTLTSCKDPDHAGKVTYYDFADGSGACSFDATPNDLMVGAMNAPDYQGSAACGACAQIDANGKSIVVRIVDLCPECQSGHIDLSPMAFSMLDDLSVGVMPVTWRYVSCDYQGPLAYKFKEGSNQYWTAVQIRHHSNRVAKFEWEKDGAWVEVERLDYNYFVEDQGMGPGPYHFRVTDIFGQTVEDTGIGFVEGGVVDGKSNFPPCQEK